MLKTYTIWGQYIPDRHYNTMYHIVVVGLIVFTLLNILLYF